MTDTTLPGPKTMEALQCVGYFFYRSLITDGDVNFSVVSRVMSDGTLLMTVLHSGGALQFEIPIEEQEPERSA